MLQNIPCIYLSPLLLPFSFLAELEEPAAGMLGKIYFNLVGPTRQCFVFNYVFAAMGDPSSTSRVGIPSADPANYDGLTFYGVSDFQMINNISTLSTIFRASNSFLLLSCSTW